MPDAQGRALPDEIAYECFGDLLLIRQTSAPTMTPSGKIHLAGTEQPDEGLVLKAGPGEWELGPSGFVLRPMRSQVGWTVLYPKYTGWEVTINGEKLVIVPDKNTHGRNTKPEKVAAYSDADHEQQQASDEERTRQRAANLLAGRDADDDGPKPGTVTAG